MGRRERTSGEGRKHGDGGIETVVSLVPSAETTALSSAARSSSDAFFHSGGTDARSCRVGGGVSVLPDGSNGVATPREMRCGPCEVRQRLEDAAGVVVVVVCCRKGGCEGV